jgi:lipopolysaccharide/colanic/teichoic acid biosynthesis glycosyltransferase
MSRRVSLVPHIEPDLDLVGGGGTAPYVHLRTSGVRHIDPSHVADARARAARHGRLARIGKRLFDVTVAVVGLMLTSPLIALVAILVRFDSRGSPLLRQVRVGRSGRHFELLKLRTMHLGGTNVTRVGRLLRPTGLDELPQFWNVLRGDMSLVGPRPEMPHLVARFEDALPGYVTRHLMRPGITGWAQVNGLRGRVSIADRLHFDLEYLRNFSLLLDGIILTRTLSTVWRDTRRALRTKR